LKGKRSLIDIIPLDKKTGKSSWTEPPKVSKATTTEAGNLHQPKEESSATELVPPLQQTHQLSRAILPELPLVLLRIFLFPILISNQFLAHFIQTDTPP
jgi:hypothetical protein